jgi:glutamyl-tRNA reductase
MEKVMGLLLLGLNHRTAPVEVREKLAFGREGAGNALILFRKLFPEAECAILSTCNRVEVLVSGEGDRPDAQDVMEFLARARGASTEEFRPHLYVLGGDDAVRQVLRVISGLDSMVLGESQIVSQMKQAYAAAHEKNAVGPVLHRLFHHAFGVSKRIRSETGIGEGKVSVSSVAMSLIERSFAGLSEASVLVVGAGEMAQQACEYLRDAGVGRLLVTTRTLTNARTLAQACGGEGVAYAELDRHVIDAEIVITATACPTSILTVERVHSAQEARGNRPILLVDLAMPRNIDPQVVEVPGVTLIDIDCLGRIVDANRGEREAAATECERIIEEEVAVFQKWVGEARARPMIDQIVQDVHELANIEVRRTLNRCANLTERQQEEVRQLVDRLVGKFLHPCLATIRSGTDLAEAFRAMRLSFEAQKRGQECPPHRKSKEEYVYHG